VSGHREPGTMPCRQLFEKLSEYIDGELDLGDCARIEGHLGDCPPCQEFLASLRRTVALIERLPRPTLTGEQRREICSAYERYRRSK